MSLRVIFDFDLESDSDDSIFVNNDINFPINSLNIVILGLSVSTILALFSLINIILYFLKLFIIVIKVSEFE
ncbi:hypothetical protein M0811_02723 [Anaeramoeba ignava]|uniref:Uncharacterized protein n=1 Tax=Anaeramoeba ignava TaxID=1746090 RepID=A0A9Q0LCJ5_ANAIG|nr:hypothetical protein M0811_02723 [Anaeramoeba ignava]